MKGHAKSVSFFIIGISVACCHPFTLHKPTLAESELKDANLPPAAT
jgi:hypothetical protein